MKQKVIASSLIFLSVAAVIQIIRYFFSYRFAVINETVRDTNETWHMAEGVNVPFWFVEKSAAIEQGASQAAAHMGSLTWLLPFTLILIVITAIVWANADMGRISAFIVLGLCLVVIFTFIPALFTVYNVGYAANMYLNGAPSYFFFYIIWVGKWLTSAAGILVLSYLALQVINILTQPEMSEEWKSNYRMEREQRRHNENMEYLAKHGK